MHDLTGFQRDLLYVFAGLGDSKGLAIKVELDEYYASDINQGRLYPNTVTLAEKGLIEKSKKDDRTNEYTLSNQGQSELDARREWEDQFIAGISTCRLSNRIRECRGN